MPDLPPDVSVVLPIHNERDNLAPLLSEIAAALRGIRYEVVAVDDASTDDSPAELHRLRRGHPMRVLMLRARSGQSAALRAGFAAATGTFVATMDADGQNDPADVARLLATVREVSGRAAVGARRRRADRWWKRLQSGIANTLRNWITGDRVRDTGCSLRVLRRDAAVCLPPFNGMHRFIPTLLRLGGTEVVEVPVSHRPRRAGHSKYGMWNRALPALVDAFGVRWLWRRRIAAQATEDATE